MTQDILLHLLAPLFSGFISLGLAFHIWQRRNIIAANQFMLILIGAAIWSFAHTFKIAAESTSMMIFYDNFAYLGMDIIALGIVTFAMVFTHNKAYQSKIIWLLLMIEPLANLAMIWTDPLHNLFRSNIQTVTTDLFNLILYDHAIWGLVVLSYFYAVVLISLLLLVQFYIRANKLIRKQTGIIILGISFPYLVGILSMLGLFDILDRDIFPLTFGLSNLFIAWGVFRFRIFDIVPVVREHIVESMHEGIIMIDEQSRILDVNPAAIEIIGVKEKDLLGHSIEDFLPNLDPALISKNEKIQIESEIKNQENGNLNIYEIRISPFSDQQNKSLGHLIFLQDITRRKILESELHRMATTDPLTGILNRRQFDMLAKRELHRIKRQKTPLSLLMMDIDAFKKINDQHGHAIGDKVLKEFTDRCQSSLRAADLFGRFGGEEFVIMLPDTNQNTAETVAARIRDCISNDPFSIPQNNIRVTACIGIAASLAGKETIEELVNTADQALYVAKNRGPNNIATAY